MTKLDPHSAAIVKALAAEEEMTATVDRTAAAIADVLQLPAEKVDFSTWNGTVTLTNAQARRLLALARKGR